MGLEAGSAGELEVGFGAVLGSVDVGDHIVLSFGLSGES